jgi:transcriptional regulator with XRE-family HTH domain
MRPNRLRDELIDVGQEPQALPFPVEHPVEMGCRDLAPLAPDLDLRLGELECGEEQSLAMLRWDGHTGVAKVTGGVTQRNAECKDVSSERPATPVRQHPRLQLKRNLRTARLASGVSVVDAAGAVEKSRQAVTAWERFELGEPVPDDRDLAILASLYGTSVPSLRTGNSTLAQSEAAFRVASRLRRAGYLTELNPAINAAGRAFMPDLVVYDPTVDDDPGVLVEVRSSLSARPDPDLAEKCAQEGYRLVSLDPSDTEAIDEAFPHTHTAGAFAHGDRSPSALLGVAEPVSRHARNVPLEVREFLAEFQLRITRAGSTEEEVERAMELLRSQPLFSWYSTGSPRDLSPDKIVLGMKAVAEHVIIPELRQRGRKL